jgi:nitric oxide reductase large subunit
VIVVGGPLSSAALVGAVRLVYPESRGERAELAAAFGVGLVAFAPALLARIVVFPGIYLLSLAWLAATMFAVPALLVEGVPPRRALLRSLRLARADAVHALGTLATLTIAIVLTALVLTFLLRGFGDQGMRVAALLALLVVTPLFFLGAAVLYADQAARDSRVEPPT